jgi:hypothetical protein
MKHYGLALILCLSLTGCETGDRESPFLPEFPPLPPSWAELLGPPRWRIRYYDAGGLEAGLETGEGAAELSLPPARVSPVLAWPYWPERGLKPGDFRPAGAVFPYDASSPTEGSAPGRLILSWQGGLEAWFFEALNRGALNQAGPPETLRRGENFDWPGFRALFSDPAILQQLQGDPWLADWDAVAEKTLRSGFRASWLKAEAPASLSVPAPAGVWVSPSPFVPPLETGGSPGLFPAGPGIRVWYSAAGILHCAGTNWILLPWV